MKKSYSRLLKQSIRDWKFWVKLLIGITQITSIIVFLIFSVIVDHYLYVIPEQLSYFTTQSNIFCGIFFIYSALFHYNEGKGRFDNSEVAKIAITYITLTIFIYNLSEIIDEDRYYFSHWNYVMSFVCEHSVVPFLAILYYLFFYNHEKAKSIKVFNKKWVWFMIAGLVAYLIFFSLIGELARFLNWKPLYGTMDGSGEQSTFVYPFMDWYHGVAFFKQLPAWLECIVMLTGTILFAVGADYVYTFIIFKLNKNIIKKNDYQKEHLASKEIKSINF